MDYLHCRQEFHGQERNDGIIVQATASEQWIGKLILIFTLPIGKVRCHLALIDKMRSPGHVSKKDEELGFHRLVEEARRDRRFVVVPALSFLRGAPLVKDTVKDREYLVWNTVDSDLALRMYYSHPRCINKGRRELG